MAAERLFESTCVRGEAAMRPEILRWLKVLLLLVWAVPGLVALFVLRKPLLEILGRCDNCEFLRIRIGPVEIEKRASAGRYSAAENDHNLLNHAAAGGSILPKG
jgi:hypothetical protein